MVKILNWRLPTLNKVMFIFKFHYFFFQAGIAPGQTFVPVYAQTLGFSSFVVGTIWTILPISGLFIKPAFGAIADQFKCHKAVMLGLATITMLSYFTIQFIPTDFVPPVDTFSKAVCEDNMSSAYLYHNQTNSMESQILVQTDKTNNCYVKCLMTPEAWQAVCSAQQMCSREFNQQVDHNSSIHKELRSQLCSQGRLGFTQCRAICNTTLDGVLKSSGDDGYQPDDVTYNQYQFYVFTVLMIGAFGGTAVTTTLSDTLCIAKDPDPHAYGRQRLWGSVGYGVLSIITGLIIDGISEPGQPKNYLPAFYMTLAILIIDVVVAYKYIKVEIPEQSQNIGIDVLWALLNIRVIVFLVWCAAMGVSMGLTWTFLYWLLEDLAKETGEDAVANIKTITGLTNGMQTFLGETPAFFFAGWVITKIGHGHTMSLILLTIGLRFLCYSFIHNPWYILFVEPLQLYYGLFYSTMTSFASKVAPPGTEATMQSIMCAVAEGVGVAIGGFVGGTLYDMYGGNKCFEIFSIAFFIMAVTNEVIELLYWFIDKRTNAVHPS